MKIRNKSAVMFVAVVLAFGTLVGNAIAKSLLVITKNGVDTTLPSVECVSDCVEFTLPPLGEKYNSLIEPSSGTATLSAIFTSSSTFSCSKNYNVITTSDAVVNVTYSSDTLHCNITIIPNH